MHINIAWQDVDIVLLSMDGTLLNLAFDNYFWQKLVPEAWDMKNRITPQEAMGYMRQQYHDIQYTLNWHCLDCQSEQLGLDICVITTEMGPRAVLREDTIPSLKALKASDKQRILLISAHPYNLAVKLEYIGLDTHLDLLPPTRILGYPKEDQWLWHTVTEVTGLETERALFIDDNEAILDAAAQFGVRYCLGVTNLDSGIVGKQYQRHPSPGDYRRLIPSLM